VKSKKEVRIEAEDRSEEILTDGPDPFLGAIPHGAGLLVLHREGVDAHAA
jgi:hypothetical protein